MIGENIRRIRIEKGLSLDELSLSIGTDKSVVERWEDGVEEPKLEDVINISSKLGVSADDLINGVVIAEPKKKKSKGANKRIWKIAAIACGIVAVLAVGTFCVFRFVVNKGPKPLSPNKIYNKLSASTVEMRVTILDIDENGKLCKRKITGTGFFVDNEGTLVTNYHVVEGAVEIKISYDGTEYSVTRFEGYDKNVDIAILYVPFFGAQSVEIRQDYVTIGEKVYSLGSSLGMTGTFSEGIISSDSRKVNGRNFIQTTAPISHGNSGGPLVDEYGKVIGVCTATFEEGQNMNLAIPISQAISVSRDNPVGIMDYACDYYDVESGMDRMRFEFKIKHQLEYAAE